MGFASFPLVKALRLIKDAGFDAVEINADYHHGHMDPRFFPRWQLPHVKKVLEDLGLYPGSVHAPADGVYLATTNPAERKRTIGLLVETREYCKAIKCPMMVLHPNCPPNTAKCARVGYRGC